MRRATAEDIEVAVRVLTALKEKRPTKQMKWADPAAVFEYMTYAATQGCVVVVDGYLIMYSTGPTWFSRAEFLIEEVIVKIAPSEVTVERAIEALEELRVLHGCVATIAGDTQIGYMAPKYMAAGYEPLGLQLIKEG